MGMIGAVALVIVTFATSYTHVRETVEAHGQHGWATYAIAAMPELSVLLATRKLLRGDRGRWVWANLVTAGAFTLTANLGLGHWPEMAAWPAWSAVAALGLLGGHAKVAEPVADVAVKATSRPRKVAPPPAEAMRPAAQQVADVAPRVARSGLVVAEATQATVRAAWEAAGRAMTDQEIAEALGVSKAAARSRRRSWDGSKASPARASKVDAL